MFGRWTLRPIMLFAAAYTIVGVLHELVHALTAYTLGVPSTLFHLYANIDRNVGALGDRAVIRAAGPVFCLGMGLIAWFARRAARDSRLDLPLLYLAWFGIATFFGNLLGTPFVGDFSGLATMFGLPMSVRYAAALIGLLSICLFSLIIGTELRHWSPGGVSDAAAMLGMVVLPAVVGTLLALLIFIPIPSDWVIGRLGEAAFWLFAAVGIFFSRKPPADSISDLGPGWPDLVLLLTSALVVRMLAGGIEFTT